MGHLGMEIAYVVDMAHHLIGRVVGFCRVVVNRFPTEFFVEPFPSFAVGLPLGFVVNPIGHLGLESAFVWLKGDIA